MRVPECWGASRMCLPTCWFDLTVLPYFAASSLSLSLVLTLVGIKSFLVHFSEDQLANAAAALQADGEGVGVENFQSDFTFEAGVHPAGVLDEQPHTAD